MKKTFYLIYQAGIANVFVDDASGNFKRVMQHAITACENFCRGLKYAGECVRVGWCNEAGDITNAAWHFKDFDNAPFSEKFAKDFVKIV